MLGKQTIKDRWNVTESFFIGITLGRWLKLLQQNKIDPIYWPRAAFVTLASIGNSFVATLEKAIFSRRIASTSIANAPVFVLGHWRSGTTLLHNILSQDSENFCFPNTYQVLNPSTFLTTEKLMAPVFDLFSDSVRPMDNVEMGMKMPQEDEFAPMLETLYSVYLSMAFPLNNDYYQRYLSFDEVADNDREEWKKAFLHFSKKLIVKNQGGRSILYKTPSHTARIKLILEMFPDAKFIHISRDPYQVMRSSQHFFDTAVWKYYFQKPDLTELDNQIIDRYNDLYDAYFHCRDMIPEGNLISLRFEEFELDPKSHVKKIYEQFNIPSYSDVEPILHSYIDSLKNYKKNKFSPLPDELREKIRTRCERHFQNLDYPLEY